MTDDAGHGSWDDRASWVPPPSEEYQKAHGWRDGKPPPNGDASGHHSTADDTKGAALFPILTVTQLADLPDPEWLIDDLMVASSLCTLYGLFRSYKSFIALDWGLCLATGTDWCDRTVKQCDVLYIAGEGVGGLKLRVAVWMQHHGITDPIPGFRIVPLAVNLMDKAEAERLILTVIEEQKRDGFDPKLVVVDTLHRSMPGADENTARDMGIAISNAALIQRRLGCAMLPVHHCGKDADRGLRGSSGLPGAADTIIRASRTDNRVTLLVEKQKDIEDGQETHLQAQVVNLPRIAGSLKPRSSLVLVQGDQPANTDDGLTKTERAASRFLADLIVAEGKPLPYGGGFPSPVRRPTPPRSGDLPMAGRMRDPSPLHRRSNEEPQPGLPTRLPGAARQEDGGCKSRPRMARFIAAKWLQGCTPIGVCSRSQATWLHCSHLQPLQPSSRVSDTRGRAGSRLAGQRNAEQTRHG